MDQLLDLLAGLEVSELASKEVHLSVLLALEEVTRHQRTLRGVLDRLERRQNREEVNLLLDMFDTDEEELQEEVGQEGLFMDSKHGQIGQRRRGDGEKKISECEGSCHQPPLHISQRLRGREAGWEPAGRTSREVTALALARLGRITGRDVTGGRTVSHQCIHCPIDGFVGTDQIVLIREVNLSSSSPGRCLLQQPDGGFRLSRNHEFYYEVQLALKVSGRRSCYFVILINRDFHYQLVGRDHQLWSSVINPTLNTKQKRAREQKIVKILKIKKLKKKLKARTRIVERVDYNQRYSLTFSDQMAET